MTPCLIGMVHLGPLPGSPRYAGDLDAVVDAAVTDAAVLEAAGLDAVFVENLGDAPFFADDVPNETVAAMTRTVTAIRGATAIPIGVNVLRNDALAALAVAAATGAGYIRVNVLSGSMYTDQGLITGRAAEVARARAKFAPGVGVFADVFVKHATPPAGLSIEDAARDTVERGGADAVIVSGAATGSAPDLDVVKRVVAAAGGAPVLLGSGVNATTVSSFLQVADGVIVGTSLKKDGITTNPVDPSAAAAFVAAANA